MRARVLRRLTDRPCWNNPCAAAMDGMGGGMGEAPAEGDTHWVECEAWGDEARQLVEHVSKGRQIMITGRLKENSWVDKVTGQKRSKLKVSLYNFAFVAPYNGGAGGGGGGGGGGYAGGGAAMGDPYAAQANNNAYNAAPAAAAAAGGAYGAAAANTGYAATPSSGGGGGGGEKDDLWRDLVNNPDAWWDNRAQKAEPGGNPRYPDFKNKDDQTPLWIESRDTPQWAVDALQGGGGGGGAVGASGAAMAAAGGGSNDSRRVGRRLID